MAKQYNSPAAPQGFAGIASGISSLLSSFFTGPLALLPGLRQFADNPMITNLIRSGEGQRLSGSLRANAPEYRSPSATESQLQIRGPNGGPLQIGLPEIGTQAVKEREDQFAALLELSNSQKEVTKGFASGLRDANSTFNKLDKMLGSAQTSALSGIGKSVAGLKDIQKQTMLMTRAGINAGTALLSEIQKQSGEVRENFAIDVSNRIESVATGIQGASKQAYNEHVRALEASGPVAPEEREAIRSMYQRDAARNIAVSAGSLHESAIELRANLETNLANITTQGAAQALGQVGGALQTGIGALLDSEKTIANLATVRAQTIQNFTIARTELGKFTEQFKLDGASALFTMISNTVYPTLVISDIMSDLFDIGWDVMAFDNNVKTQEFQNLMAIENPQNVSIMAVAGQRDQNRQFEQQIEVQNRQARNALWGAGIGAAGNILGGAAQGALTPAG